MDMVMDMVDMDMDTMERGKLLLSLDTITMDTAIMEVMDTIIMERERPMLSLATIITAMDMVMDMVDMDMDTMERGKLMLSPVIIIMVMDMVMVMATVMDTMVKQQLFIDSSIFSIIDLDFLKSSQQKHTIIKN